MKGLEQYLAQRQWRRAAKELVQQAQMPTPSLVGVRGVGSGGMGCQEIGLVALMFFFELLFSYVSLAISFDVSLTNIFSIIPFLYLLITRDTQDEGEARFNLTTTENSPKFILRLRNLSRFPNQPLDPIVDLC